MSNPTDTKKLKNTSNASHASAFSALWSPTMNASPPPDLAQLFAAPLPLKEREIISCLKTLRSFTQDLPTHRQHPRYHAVLQAAKRFLSAVERAEQNPRPTASISESSSESSRPSDLSIHSADSLQTEDALLSDPSISIASDPALPSDSALPFDSALPSSGQTATFRILQRRHCYACKQAMLHRHPRYDAFCVPCGEINWNKRHQSADLSGRCAIVTGGRSKIGYATSLKLLRAGAKVLITTRFPKHAVERFAKEHDFAYWRERLIVHGIDLRSFPAIAAFTQEVPHLFNRLDILINNAAQTIRRPPRYYHPLIAAETTPFSSPDLSEILSPSSRQHYDLCRHLPPPFASPPTTAISSAARTDTPPEIQPSQTSITPWLPPTGIASLGEIAPAWRQHASFLSGVPFLPEDLLTSSQDFPTDQINRYGELADMRDLTSWEMEIDQVHPFELFEVHTINAMAPFLLMRDLRPLMLQTPDPMRFIVNVTSTEGQFSSLKDPLRTTQKGPRHPHTNMTKAALNMLTLSGANTDAKVGIFRTAVDPGWASIENGRSIREQWFALGIDSPLTIEDAAARLCDPIFSPLLHQTPPPYGVLLKDFRIVHW
ncbi:SDR family NAD(P)-dependent oxidoreductase [Myxococcota bacterium]|nr:SDR family NAD(P)-dependent oxidoreductase [Myxococcota bacterium]